MFLVDIERMIEKKLSDFLHEGSVEDWETNFTFEQLKQVKSAFNNFKIYCGQKYKDEFYEPFDIVYSNVVEAMFNIKDKSCKTGIVFKVNEILGIGETGRYLVTEVEKDTGKMTIRCLMHPNPKFIGYEYTVMNEESVFERIELYNDAKLNGGV